MPKCVLSFEQLLQSNRFQWDSDTYLRPNGFYSDWRWVPVFVMRQLTGACYFHLDMHAL